MAKRKRFGEILVEAKVVDEYQLQRALEKQRGTGRRLGQVLEEMGVVTERDIAAVLARQFGFKTVSNIAKAKFGEEILSFTDADTAIAKLIFPLKKEGKNFFLAMVNPLDIETIENLSFRSGLRIVACVTTPSEIQAAVNRHYYNILQDVELAGHDPAVVIEVPEEKPAAKSGWWTILVVEDQEAVRSNIMSVLKREGYHLLQATNGEEGLRLALQEHPHLIISETSAMPIMDGYEMFRAIQANQSIKQIPLIALSSKPSAEEEAKLLEMGYYDYITKPINPVRLAARTRHALRLIYGTSPPPR